MNLELVFDPLFRVPLLLGLVLAGLLPVLGAYLRMRDEWLAALGYTHIAAAGALASGIFGVPVFAAAFAAGALAAVAKGLVRRPGNDLYAAMTIGGWALALVVAANSHHGEVLGQTLLRGQLYFAEPAQLWFAIGLALVVLALLRWLSPRLLLQRFFPDHFSANLERAWPLEVLFALLVVLTLVAATAALGAMAAFALVFIPPWVAFRLCSGWRRAVAVAAVLGMAAHLAAFTAAIALDQPFGPVLALVLLAVAALRLAGRRM